MKKQSLLGGIGLVALIAAGPVHAADVPFVMPVKAMPNGSCDPYVRYSCLDAYLGEGFFERLANYYRLEWGRDGPPADPKAPPARRPELPPQPVTSPPYPFTEWPYGGTTNLGTTRPNSVDSPLMVALANTSLGKAMDAAHIQVYGWVNIGANVSNQTLQPGGNWPAAYMYTPNTWQLDQAVVYVERLPDTVQKDHVDWGFRFSYLYGENYRYTTAYGLMSYQLLNRNAVNGSDFPMVYGELFVPGFFDGLLFRVGRFISLPDIEAQLAPNNYMYSHSMTYGYDNYTNTGIQTSLLLNKNWTVQLGVTVGTEAMPWHMGKTMPNPFPNPLYPGNTMLVDPGARPSVTGCVRYQTDSGWDNIYLCADAINSGVWGYNNLQWYGGTYYHKFNEQWHISFEAYWLWQRNVANLNNPDAVNIINMGGTPFSPQYIPNNAPNGAQCLDPTVLSCTARVQTYLAYLNYKFSPRDNLSFRSEFYNDIEGQRTGTKTRYLEFALGWQHWFSPQVLIRPEIAFYKSLDAPAFNGNANLGIAPTKDTAIIAAMDLIVHF